MDQDLYQFLEGLSDDSQSDTCGSPINDKTQVKEIVKNIVGIDLQFRSCIHFEYFL